MKILDIEKDTCTQCGICADVCPGNLIYYKENHYPRLIPGTDPFCLKCGHCVAVCPSGSINHVDIPVEQCPTIDQALKVNIQQVEQLIKGRRSIRVYKQKQVPRELIEKAIDIARYAPTGHNNQGVKWLVINDRNAVKKLSNIGTDWLRWEVQTNSQLAPMLERTLKRQESGIDTLLRNAPAVVIAFKEGAGAVAVTDSVIALSYFDLAAGGLGLGCCWAGLLQMAANTFPAMQEALALPEGHKVHGCMMVGYPEYQYQRIPLRKPASIIWLP